MHAQNTNSCFSLSFLFSFSSFFFFSKALSYYSSSFFHILSFVRIYNFYKSRGVNIREFLLLFYLSFSLLSWLLVMSSNTYFILENVLPFTPLPFFSLRISAFPIKSAIGCGGPAFSSGFIFFFIHLYLSLPGRIYLTKGGLLLLLLWDAFEM